MPAAEHTEQPLLRVLQLKVLVGELVPIDALATSAVASCEVASLNHKVLDHAVEA